MTITSSGQLLTGPTTSAGDFVSGNITMSGAVLIGTTPTIKIYPIIEYNEDTIMYQKPGTTENHPVQIRSETTGALATESLTTVEVYYSINGAAEVLWSPDPTISAYSNNMTRHLISVPDILDSHTFVDGDKLEFSISADQGSGHGMIYFMTPLSDILATYGAAKTTDLSGLEVDLTGIATSTNITDAVTAITGGSETLESINTAIDGISGGGGAEKVIPASNYTLDASAKTLTLISPYNTVTVEQVLLITDLTTGDLIYDSKDPTKHSIGIVDGVITYTYNGSGITSTPVSDKIQILVNTV